MFLFFATSQRLPPSRPPTPFLLVDVQGVRSAYGVPPR